MSNIKHKTCQTYSLETQVHFTLNLQEQAVQYTYRQYTAKRGCTPNITFKIVKMAMNSQGFKYFNSKL